MPSTPNATASTSCRSVGASGRTTVRRSTCATGPGRGRALHRQGAGEDARAAHRAPSAPVERSHLRVAGRLGGDGVRVRPERSCASTVPVLHKAAGAAVFLPHDPERAAVTVTRRRRSTARRRPAARATAGSDYEERSGTLLFQPGETTKTAVPSTMPVQALRRTGQRHRHRVVPSGRAEGSTSVSSPGRPTCATWSSGCSSPIRRPQLRPGTGTITNTETLEATFQNVPQDRDGSNTFTFNTGKAQEKTARVRHRAPSAPVEASRSHLRVAGRLDGDGEPRTTFYRFVVRKTRDSDLAWTVTVRPAGTDSVTTARPCRCRSPMTPRTRATRPSPSRCRTVSVRSPMTPRTRAETFTVTNLGNVWILTKPGRPARIRVSYSVAGIRVRG